MLSNRAVDALIQRRLGPWLDSFSRAGLHLTRGQRLVRYQSDHVALVRSGKQRLLVQSTLPLRAVGRNGEKQPVSLRLVDSGNYHAPANALVNVHFSDQLRGGLRFPDAGVAVRPLGVDGATKSVVSRSRVLYPNADAKRAMDFLAVPVATGAETINVLRSRDSPSRLRYAVDTPSGATLRADAHRAGALGVVKDGHQLLSFSPVRAVDSAGTPVDARYQITRAGFDILVSPRKNTVYPIVVDPAITVDQRYFDVDSGIYFKGWDYVQMGPWHTLFTSYSTSPATRGLHIWNPPNYYIGNGFWGMWRFRAPGDAYITSAEVGHFMLLASGTITCADAGLYDAAGGTGWNQQTFTVNSSPTVYDGRLHACFGFLPATLRFTAKTDTATGTSRATKANALAVQWSANGSYWRPGSDLLYLGGASMTIRDDNPPYGLQQSGLPSDDSWVREVPRVTFSASDGGTGVKTLSVSRSSPQSAAIPSSDGNPVCDTTDVHQPTLYCPTTTSRRFDLAAPEGVSYYDFVATDATGGTTTSRRTVRLDTKGPAMTASGHLSTLQDKVFFADSYDLRVVADDNGGSGVRDVTVAIEGQPAKTESASCAATCVINTSLTGDGLDPGPYNVTYSATDRLGNTSSRTFTVHKTVLEEDPTENEQLDAAQSFRTQLHLNSDPTFVRSLLNGLEYEDTRMDYGVPLTASERTDVQHRQEITESDSSVDDYVASHPEGYAGSYVDQADHGRLVVRYVGDPASHIDAIRQLYPYPADVVGQAAQRSLDDLDALSATVQAELDDLAQAGIVITWISKNIEANKLTLGVASPTASILSALVARFGSAVELIDVSPILDLEATGAKPIRDRARRFNPLRAGILIAPDDHPTRNRCTSAFPYVDRHVLDAHGEPVKAVLTAGHCTGQSGSSLYKWQQGGGHFGDVIHRAVGEESSNDVAAIGVFPDSRSLSSLLHISRTRAYPITSLAVSRDGERYYQDKPGTIVCIAGAFVGHNCGTLTGQADKPFGPLKTKNLRVASYRCGPGNSGAPISIENNRAHRAAAVGIHIGGGRYKGRPRCFYMHIGHVRQSLDISHNDFVLGDETVP